MDDQAFNYCVTVRGVKCVAKLNEPLILVGL